MDPCPASASAPSSSSDADDTVPRIALSTLSVARFRRFLRDNRPLLLTGVTSEWAAAREWIGADGTLDAEALSARHGACVVPVVACDHGEYGEQPRHEAPLSEYLEQWRRGEQAHYLKDWHFVRDCPDAAAYTTPAPFADDWLNWWWSEQRGGHDDYRFVYLGPAGSWTPLHHDVMLSYSWSANVCGRKRWLLFPPSETAKLLSRTGRQLASDVRAADADEFPMLATARCVEVVQEAGEALFVPSGWHHQVENLEPTLSVNHNWFNGFSVLALWCFLRAELDAVRAAIDDCRASCTAVEWEAQCERVMACDVAINVSEFFALLVARVGLLDDAHGHGAAEEGAAEEGEQTGEDEWLLDDEVWRRRAVELRLTDNDGDGPCVSELGDAASTAYAMLQVLRVLSGLAQPPALHHLFEWRAGAIVCGDAAPTDPWAAGTVVTVRALQGATQHNGKRGKVLRYNSDADRYETELETGETLKIKPANLEKAAAGDDSDDRVDGKDADEHRYAQSRQRVLRLARRAQGLLERLAPHVRN